MLYCAIQFLIKTVCFIISNSDSKQFEFTYLTKLLSTFKVSPSFSKEQENVKKRGDVQTL